MFPPPTEHRRRRLAQLFDQIEETDDSVLKSVLKQSSADELSVVLAIFSLERAQRVLAGIPPEQVSKASALIRHGEHPPEPAVMKLAQRVLGNQATA